MKSSHKNLIFLPYNKLYRTSTNWSFCYGAVQKLLLSTSSTNSRQCSLLCAKDCSVYPDNYLQLKRCSVTHLMLRKSPFYMHACKWNEDTIKYPPEMLRKYDLLAHSKVEWQLSAALSPWWGLGQNGKNDEIPPIPHRPCGSASRH